MKSVLILGATSDVGVALAKKFSTENYEIMLAGRSQKNIEPIKSDLEIRNDSTVSIYEFDAENTDSHSDFINRLPQKPDVVICVFGYLGDQETAQKDWTEASRILAVNFTGAVSILEKTAKMMEKRGNGTIVGISSVAGERGRQSNYFYGAAKAGFTAFLSGLRNRLYHKNIHVVTIKPGFIDTKMTEGMDLPKPLTASPEKVALSIFKAVKSKSNTIYVLSIWRLIMYIIKSIPDVVFKRLKM